MAGKLSKWASDLGKIASDAASLAERSVAGPLERRLFYLHIQKCGGTSVNDALKRLYRSANPAHQSGIVHLNPGAAYRASKAVDMGMYSYRQMLAHYYLQDESNAFVTGHFQVDERLVEEYRSDVGFVVLFREPVEKWYSHYFFNRYKDEKGGKIEVPLEEYLQKKRARDVGCDYVQLLTGRADRPTEQTRRDEVFEEAMRTLEKFDVVGVLDEMTRFVDDFERVFGVELSIPHRNRSPASGSKAKRREEEFTPAQRDRVREFCEPNIRLYRAVRRHLGLD